MQRNGEGVLNNIENTGYASESTDESMVGVGGQNVSVLKKVFCVNISGSLTKLSQNGETTTTWKWAMASLKLMEAVSICSETLYTTISLRGALQAFMLQTNKISKNP